jgi:hypothetical protein
MNLGAKTMLINCLRLGLKLLGPSKRTSLLSLILENKSKSSPEVRILSKNTVTVQLVLEEFTDSIPGYHYLNKSFSQNGEDLAIERLMENHPIGRYIDVGAHHPFRFSNTALLNLKGWIGTNVDPNPISMSHFNLVRPQDNNVCAALGSAKLESNYYEFEESALNTFSEEIVKKHSVQNIFPSKITQTQVIDSKQFLEQTFTPDTFFLSVDAEGMDISILEDLDFKFFYPCWIVMENQYLSIQEFEKFTLSNSFLKNYQTKGLVGNSIILFSSGCNHVAI